MATSSKTLREQTGFELAVVQFEKVKESLKDTKYELMADVEISKLLKAQAAADAAKEETRARSNVIQKKAEVEPKETVTEKKTEEKPVAQSTPDDEGRKAQDDATNAIFTDILNGEFRAAAAKLSEHPEKDSFATLTTAIDIARNVDKMLVDSLASEIGSEVEFDVGSEKVKLKIIEVKGGKIRAERKMEKGFIIATVGIEDLTPAERLRRTSSIDKTAGALLVAAEALKTKKYEAAEKALAEAGPFSTKLLERLNELRPPSKETELAAKSELERMLGLVGLKSSAHLDEITDELKRIKTKRPSPELAQTLDEFKQKFARTAFVKRAEHVVEELSRIAAMPDAAATLTPSTAKPPSHERGTFLPPNDSAVPGSEKNIKSKARLPQ